MLGARCHARGADSVCGQREVDHVISSGQEAASLEVLWRQDGFDNRRLIWVGGAIRTRPDEVVERSGRPDQRDPVSSITVYPKDCGRKLPEVVPFIEGHGGAPRSKHSE